MILLHNVFDKCIPQRHGDAVKKDRKFEHRDTEKMRRKE